MQGANAGMLALRGSGVVQVPREDAASRREATAREVMRAFDQYSIPALWPAWLLYWTSAVIGAKATLREESFASRLSHVIPLALGTALLATPHVPMAWLAARFLPRTAGWFWLGFVLVALGLAVSVAARTWLGRNWSSMVTLKHVYITDDDVDENWQLHDIETLMHPYRAQVRTIDAQLVEALEDSQ